MILAACASLTVQVVATSASADTMMDQAIQESANQRAKQIVQLTLSLNAANGKLDELQQEMLRAQHGASNGGAIRNLSIVAAMGGLATVAVCAQQMKGLSGLAHQEQLMTDGFLSIAGGIATVTGVGGAIAGEVMIHLNERQMAKLQNQIDTAKMEIRQTETQVSTMQN